MRYVDSTYHIAGNFRGVKFSQNDDYKVFAGLIFEDRRNANDHTPTILTTPPAGSADQVSRTRWQE